MSRQKFWSSGSHFGYSFQPKHKQRQKDDPPRKECKSPNPEPEEETEEFELDPSQWYLRENMQLERVLSDPIKSQHVVYLQSGAQQTVFPSDMVMTRILEMVPLSAFTSYLLAHNMTTIQLEFNTWRAASANASIPIGIKPFNKLCYIVFLYNYERIVAKKSDESDAESTSVSLLQRIVQKYFERSIMGVSNMQQALEKELADDCEVALDVWLRNKKFSTIGIVDISEVDPSLTVPNVLSQLQLFGVRYDPEVMSYGIPGMSDMAVISLLLSSVATSVTKTQLDLINKTFKVSIMERVKFNPLVNEIVQQFKLSYVSNQANVKTGIYSATQ